MCHFFVDENGRRTGEHRTHYNHIGKLFCKCFTRNGHDYGEVKTFNDVGTLRHHYLKDGKGNEIATVIRYGKPAINTEGQLIEIAKEHGLPLLSELPKTEAEVTLWNLKHPDCPCLLSMTTPTKPTQVGIISRIKQWFSTP